MKNKRRTVIQRRRLCLAGLLFLLSAALPASLRADSLQEGQYSFSVEEFAKKAFSLTGYFEFRPSISSLRRDSSFYRLTYFDRDKPLNSGEGYFGLLSELTYEKGLFEATVEPYVEFTTSPLESDLSSSLFQAYVQLKPSVSLSISAGKRTLRWGKGYAWTPTAFAERTKNPSEPDLAREGYWMIAADYILSFQGALRTLSFTPVLIPVSRSINGDFSSENGLSFAGKLYLLLWDTDIDLVVLAGKGSSSRYGLDFSRNLLPNWEVHGEIAHLRQTERLLTSADGTLSTEFRDVTRFLIGMRHLTASEITTILEYYHNGQGYDPLEMSRFHSLVDTGYGLFLNSGDDRLLVKAAGLRSYAGFSPMRDYLFLRTSQKDSLGILYFSPAATVIWNLSDGSASLIPEVSYRGITNVEIRLRTAVLIGKNMEEFGEKPARFRFELRARFFF